MMFILCLVYASDSSKKHDKGSSMVYVSVYSLATILFVLANAIYVYMDYIIRYLNVKYHFSMRSMIICNIMISMACISTIFFGRMFAHSDYNAMLVTSFMSLFGPGYSLLTIVVLKLKGS